MDKREMEEEKKKIASNFAKVRKASTEDSQEQVSDKIGLGRSTLTGWETRAPELFVRLKNLSLFYGVSADDLLGLEKVPVSDVRRRLESLLEGVTEAALADIFEVVKVLAQADRVRQEDAHLRESLMNLLHHMGGDELESEMRRVVDLDIPISERFVLLSSTLANYRGPVIGDSSSN